MIPVSSSHRECELEFMSAEAVSGSTIKTGSQWMDGLLFLEAMEGAGGTGEFTVLDISSSIVS